MAPARQVCGGGSTGFVARRIPASGAKASKTTDQLVGEERRLARPCVHLKDSGPGPVAAIWYEQEREAVAEEVESTGELLWPTLDSTFIPHLPHCRGRG